MFKKPSALDDIDGIFKKKEGKEPLFFLDYDGTLVPIRAHPKDAILPEVTKSILEKLGNLFITYIISGRGLKDIQELVGLKNLYYIGSHGFQFENLQKKVVIYPEAVPFREEIDQAYSFLWEHLSKIPGIFLENKEFSIAIHYRQVVDGLELIEKGVSEACILCKGLKRTFGKKVFELRPHIDWHKGKALLSIMENISSTKGPHFPIVVGDDVTDEDAFSTAKGLGATIAVQENPKDTEAEYILKDPQEVSTFLTIFMKKTNI